MVGESKPKKLKADYFVICRLIVFIRHQRYSRQMSSPFLFFSTESVDPTCLGLHAEVNIYSLPLRYIPCTMTSVKEVLVILRILDKGNGCLSFFYCTKYLARSGLNKKYSLAPKLWATAFTPHGQDNENREVRDVAQLKKCFNICPINYL